MLLSPKAAFAAALAAGLLLGLDPAHAGPSPGPDQSQTAVDGNLGITFFSPVGQSFTPSQTSLDFVTLAFDGLGGPSTTQVDILSGAGFGGTVLGTSQVTALTDYNLGGGGGTTTTFTFSSPVALTAGSLYTIRIDSPSGQAVADDMDSNPYAGGQEYKFGSPVSGSDLYFMEGTQPVPAPPPAVPEPSSPASFACGALGLAGLGLAARRRRAVKGTMGRAAWSPLP